MSFFRNKATGGPGAGNDEAPRRRRVSKVVALGASPLLALGLVGGGLALAITPANAATFGPGYTDSSQTDLGAFVVNGVNTYCVDPGASPPMGNTNDDGVQSSLTTEDGNTLSATQMAQINYVVSNYGQTQDNNQAAAVDFVVRYLANPSAMVSEEGNPGTTFDSAVQWQYTTMNGNGPAVNALADQYLSEAQSISPSSGGGTGQVAITMNVNQSDNYQGTATFSTLSPSPVTGTITLTNGVFTATGQSSMTGTFSQGESLDVKGVPPTPGAPYQISGSFNGTGGASGYAASLHVYTTSGEQTTVSGGNTTVPVNVSGSFSDPMARTDVFSPNAVTQADAQYYKAGDSPVDDVTVGLGKNSDGTTNEWMQASDGNYAPVKIDATLYYLGATKPVEGESLPASAVAVGTGSVTLGGSTTNPVGTTATITMSSPIPAGDTGYFTFVDGIKGSEQIAALQPWLDNGASYSWSDTVHTNESTIVPPNVTTVAKSGIPATANVGAGGAAVPETGLGLPLTDTIQVTGNVDASEGFYVVDQYYTFSTATDSVGDLTAPTGAPVCNDSTLDYSSPKIPITQAGDYAATFNSDKVGVGTWVESLYSPAGQLLSGGAADNCNVASEWSAVKQLVVTTQAASNSNGTASDTATVWGTVPAGAQLSSVLYNQTGSAASASDQSVATAGPVGLNQGLANGTVYTLPSVSYPTSMKTGYFVESVYDLAGDIIDQGARGGHTETILAGAGDNGAGAGGNGAGAGAAAAKLPIVSG